MVEQLGVLVDSLQWEQGLSLSLLPALVSISSFWVASSSLDVNVYMPDLIGACYAIFG